MKNKLLLVSGLILSMTLLASCSQTSTLEGCTKASLSGYRLEKHHSLDVFRANGMPSIGSAKILVVPVYFSDTTDPVPTTEEIETIKKAYFGSKSETGWESLTSFYEASSYGKLHIGGTVTSAYKDPRTSLAFETEAATPGNTALISLIGDVVSYAKANWNINTADYDADKDGFIDAVELVYFTGRPLRNQGGSTIWWALTSYLPGSGNKEDPIASRYFWSPYAMITNGYYSTNIDTHVLVHETGHALGLNDYYSYDMNAEGKYASAPAGGIDMMDFNIGDHDAYSKMILGWADPYVVDGSKDNFSITLHSFVDTGEFVLLRDSKTDPWNGMPYDEYLILQYYTPTGLNEQDSKGYKEWVGKSGWEGTYKTYGLQVFHIDSRLFNMAGDLDTTTGSIKNVTSMTYTDAIRDETIMDKTNWTYSYASFIAESNSTVYSVDVEKQNVGSPNRLINIIPASKTTKFMTADYMSSIGLTNNLFGVGEEYGSDSFSMADYSSLFNNGTKFNDGSSLPYSFKVTSNDASSCAISFSSLS